MAVYNLNSKKKKSEKNVKKIVGFSLIGISSVSYFFLTGVWGALYSFYLGMFGIFSYVLFLALFVVGLALVNGRRYAMSKRYLFGMIFTIFFFLSILQLIIVGGRGSATFWEYLALNYTAKWTAGGFITGILNTILLYTVHEVGAYILLVVFFLLSLALFLDGLNIFGRKKEKPKFVGHSIKKTDIREKEPEPVKVKKEEVNVVLSGNLEEEKQEEKKAISTRELLGLDKKRNRAYEEPKQEEKPAKKQDTTPRSLRDIILTPPEINYEEYFKGLAVRDEEVQKNVKALKKESEHLTTNSNLDVKVDEFRSVNNPFMQNYSYERQPERQPEKQAESVAEVASDRQAESVIFPRREEAPKVEEDIEEFIDNEEMQEKSVIDQADDIIRSAVNEEIMENPDMFENAEPATSDSFDRRELRRDGMFAPSFPERGDRREVYMREEVEPVNEDIEEVNDEPYVYEKPPLELITTKSVDLSIFSDDVAEKSVLLENTLENFGVPAKVQGVVVGPAVTRYELEMPQGISVSKIKNKTDDIALTLATEGAIRIEAPVPGKSVVGVEVPNKSIATVSLRDVLESREFMQSTSPLTFALGKDITGKIITCDMQKLTHLLVAGSTGSGKSVCLNSIILSILYKASPEEVKIVLIDPKRVEFSSYNLLPHLIMPNVVCDTQKAVNTLTWAVNEMERRFELLGMARVRNIDEFNNTPDVLSGKVKKMPFIIIIVDELADLMMQGKKEVEEKIVRLAQKARAAGIHLILATQRPSVDVITGLIKTNIPSRISFAVTSAVDSLTILGRVGAEKLLGKGDMLYYPIGAADPKRVQACFLTTNEINNIVDYVRDNNLPIYDKKIEKLINNPNQNTEGQESRVNNELDDLFPDAVKTAIECGQASATMLRRKFGVGYARAARILDQMEKAEYISPADGPKGRKILITEEQYNQIFGKKGDNND